MHKFVRNTTELGGTLAAPLLLAVTFGAGMQGIVDQAAIGGMNYLSFITPGILGFTALSGAVNSGMTILEEKIRGYLKQYLVAPIPRMSVLLASTLSGFVKTLVQSLLILVIAIVFGAQLATSALGIVGALIVLALFMLAIVGFANGVALRSKSIGGYHTLLFLLNLPLLFLRQRLLSAGRHAVVDARRGADEPYDLRGRWFAADPVRGRQLADPFERGRAGAVCAGAAVVRGQQFPQGGVGWARAKSISSWTSF